MASSEQCAVGSDGNLLPATEIQWFNDPDDKTPIAAPSKDQPQLEGRGHRKKSKKFAQMLLAEQHDENGKFITIKPRRSRTAAAPKKSVLSKNSFEVLDVEDSGDESFEASASGSSTESESDSNNVSMKEISTMLPSKTVPEHSSKASKPHLRTKKSDKAKGKRRQRSQSPARDSVDAPPSAKQPRICPAQLSREDSNMTSTSVRFSTCPMRVTNC
ncbi:hypothetical protein C8R44DRAFT_941074 [Mycena epipterygia]|nr:hypothetical protein C8R44DRAFT_941074 [Mycena epipterygia]